MKPILLLSLMLLLLMGACTPMPKPIEYGSDACHFCKMTIVDRQHAAESVTMKGKVYKFDAIECMVNHIHQEGEEKFSLLLVNVYDQPGKLVDASNTKYLISKNIPSPMGAYLSAFTDEKTVQEVQQIKGGEVYEWEEVKKQLIAQRENVSNE